MESQWRKNKIGYHNKKASEIRLSLHQMLLSPSPKNLKRKSMVPVCRTATFRVQQYAGRDAQGNSFDVHDEGARPQVGQERHRNATLNGRGQILVCSRLHFLAHGMLTRRSIFAFQITPPLKNFGCSTSTRGRWSVGQAVVEAFSFFSST